MKTDTLKKSLLDYAIKGKLTAKFRRENNGLNAFDELEIYNDNIKQKRKNLEKKLKICEKELKLEKDKEQKAFLKSQIQSLKKEIVKCKEITPLNFSEAPFTIPNSWAWVKLGDICEIISGEIIDLQEENLPLLDVKYLRSKGDKKLANSGNFANANDRLILMDGENSGEIFITKEKGFLGSTLKKLEFSSLSQVEFMDFMLLCYKDFFKGNKKGAAIPHLDRKLFTNLSIPLPPLCEQQEIVKKLDLLVSLANDFAITKENLKRIEKRIEKSLLKLALEGSLSKLYRRNSPTLSAFNEISTYNDNIKQKRKDLEKEFKKCEKEFKLEKDKDKKALCKSQIQMLKKELTKCKEIVPLNLSEAPFTIPNSWAWVKLGDICEIVSGGTPSRDKIEYWHNGTIPWVKIADVKNNVVNQTQEFITELGLENSSAKIFKKGTLLYTIFATLGETAILNIDAATNQAIAALIEAYDYDTKFLMYCLMSMKDYVNSLGRGVAQNNINQTMLKNFSIPLPPLCEQEHIVQTLDTLFTLKKGLRVD
ncbi:restriction endonuclease subunit S [Campylobacter upsaliensis]|uniref:restriction endonuclease subunit S n=1 Tax=Campylobacter upsaliensis TaxID=28080 RepID=UPI0022EA551F|nr:restriction endonuclease subunit S [Campylobacter upsaliensis]MEB2831032.1 restriction endonuclease subunit S [Campylobacter upsaliensis]